MVVALLTCAGLVRYLSTERGTSHKWLCPNLGSEIYSCTKFAERPRMCESWGGGAKKLWLVPGIGTHWCGNTVAGCPPVSLSLIVRESKWGFFSPREAYIIVAFTHKPSAGYVT